MTKCHWPGVLREAKAASRWKEGGHRGTPPDVSMPCFPNEEEEEQDVAFSSSWESQEGCGDWGGGQMDELSEELSSNSPRIHEPRYRQVGVTLACLHCREPARWVWMPRGR